MIEASLKDKILTFRSSLVTSVSKIKLGKPKKFDGTSGSSSISNFGELKKFSDRSNTLKVYFSVSGS
jgi:hypothetical protein